MALHLAPRGVRFDLGQYVAVAAKKVPSVASN